MADTGRPEYTDEQYQKWLDDMAPFLKAGNTLYYAMEKASLLQHQTTLYEKYRRKDWFSQKVDAYRRYPAELVNNIFYKIIDKVNDRLKNDQPITEDDMKNVRFFAEKHRTAQTFFVNRNENAEADESKVGKILDELEETNYDYVGQQAKGQMVANDPPVQNQEQAGANSNVQA